MLLRHHSVGAWRALWSELVGEVLRGADPVSRDELHVWIRNHVGVGTVSNFVNGLPSAADAEGQPLPAEDEVREDYPSVEGSIGILILGALRLQSLQGEALDAFLGGSARRRLYLDPHWVLGQYTDYQSRSMADFACALVDDMLAQSHRVALRKMRVESSGQMIMPTKLHEREGRWFAESEESSANIGVRTQQIGQIGTQLGIFAEPNGLPSIGDFGGDLLNLTE
jgi:hypothetical protein